MENEAKLRNSYQSDEQIEEQSSYDFDSDNFEEDGMEDNYEEEVNVKSSNKATMIFILLLILVLIGAGVFLAMKMTSNNNGGSSSGDVVESVDNNNDTLPEVSDSFFEDSGDSNTNTLGVDFSDDGEVTVTGANPSQEGTNSEQPEQKNDTIKPDDIFDNGLDNSIADNTTESANENSNIENGMTDNSIMVAWNRSKRQNPFKPPIIKKEQEEQKVASSRGDGNGSGNNVKFEIIEPPKEVVHDDNLTRLLQTQISGILYDDESPSAIVNISGKDQFVKVGDEISGYKVRSISRAKVEISYKNNTYVASVGELFTPGNLEQQSDVANLSSKFAGRYRRENIEE